MQVRMSKLSQIGLQQSVQMCSNISTEYSQSMLSSHNTECELSVSDESYCKERNNSHHCKIQYFTVRPIMCVPQPQKEGSL